ncbi:hypothetical protein ABZ413_05000 [Nocardia rhamnosiphila]|uniref:hypothetical protein n=1 Tax=Nocardia rhamnosiphila TaxID=426716 RepID=UPI0033D47F76
MAEAAARPADFSSNLTATMMVHPDGAVTEIELAALGDAGQGWPPVTIRCTGHNAQWCCRR